MECLKPGACRGRTWCYTGWVGLHMAVASGFTGSASVLACAIICHEGAFSSTGQQKDRRGLW